MSDEELEAEVLEYLERRQSEPALTPEAFASGRAESAELRKAIHTALDLERILPASGQAPRAIGPYNVLGEIGRGGMGIVYRVERDGRDFALKLLPLAPILGPRVLERFRREAETLAQLSHPHIVRVHDTGMHDEMPFLVMDLVEGQSLQQVAPSLSRAEAAKLVESLGETIEAAHRQGVLHRDLKPHNVMVRPDGTPVLLDFGLSVAEEFPTLTATGEILGTPRYMAPEQLLGSHVDARTDVFALGLILYELVTRRPAYREESRDALLEAVRRGRVAAPRAIDRSIPRELEKILRTAVARSPDRRYASAGLFAEDVGRFRRGEPVTARPPGGLILALEDVRTWPARTLGMWLRSASEPTLDERRRMFDHLDRATTLWLDGDESGARAELARAQRLDPREPTARLLATHLSGGRVPAGRTPSLRAAQESLRLYQAGAFNEAVTKMRSCAGGELRASLVSAVVGLGSAGGGDPTAALEELSVAASLLPESFEIRRGLGRVFGRLDRYPEAARAYRRAAELAPGSAEIWAELAEAHLQQRDLSEGLLAIAKAESLSATEGPRILRIRAGLEMHAGRHAEALRLASRVLELDPDDVEARYQVAYSQDLDHDMVAAERSYRYVLEAKPDHASALLCLANLHSGASRGQCKGCDAFYAAHPESLDQGKAEQYLLRCLESDRGKSTWVIGAIRDITMRLERRDAVIGLLERLTAAHDGTPAMLRMEEVLRRFRVVT